MATVATGLALFSGVTWFGGVAMLPVSVFVGLIANSIAAAAVARASVIW